MKPTKADYLVLIVLFIIMLVLTIFCFIKIDNKNNHIESLEAQMKDVIAKHNNVNHKLIESRKRNQELEESNTALIKVCNPSQFRRAAQNTELPKMKGC